MAYWVLLFCARARPLQRRSYGWSRAIADVTEQTFTFFVWFSVCAKWAHLIRIEGSRTVTLVFVAPISSERRSHASQFRFQHHTWNLSNWPKNKCSQNDLNRSQWSRIINNYACDSHHTTMCVCDKHAPDNTHATINRNQPPATQSVESVHCTRKITIWNRHPSVNAAHTNLT